MITRALYDYLTDNRDLTGHAAERFRTDQIVEGMTCRTRNDARRFLRSRVGNQIFAERRPQESDAHTAITLRRISSTAEFSLSGTEPFQQSLLQLDVWTRGGEAVKRGYIIAKLLELATSSYHHDYWGTTYIGDVTIERELSSFNLPADGSDYWTHNENFDVLVHHATPAAAYPTRQLQTVITFLTAYNAGDWFKVSVRDSIIPENRTLDTIRWQVTTSSLTFDTTVDLETVANTATVVYADRVLEIKRTLGLESLPVIVRATLTDDTGTTSTAQEIQSG